MDKQELYNYLMTTPQNSNPNVLGTLIGDSGGSSLPEGVVLFEGTKTFDDTTYTYTLDLGEDFESIQSAILDADIAIANLNDGEHFEKLITAENSSFIIGTYNYEIFGAVVMLYIESQDGIVSKEIRDDASGKTIVSFWIDENEEPYTSQVTYAELEDLRSGGIVQPYFYCDGAAAPCHYFNDTQTYEAVTDEYIISINSNDEITITSLQNQTII